jgi:hypothetical protein
MRGAHRQIPGIDFVVQRQRRAAVGQRRGLPRVLIQLGQLDRLALRLGADAHNIARKFTDHVAARDPCRQRENLAAFSRRATVTETWNKCAARSWPTMV